MGRTKTLSLDLPYRLGRDKRTGSLRYKRPDADRYVYLADIPEPVAVQFVEVLTRAFGPKPMRGNTHLYRQHFRQFDWSRTDPELRKLAAAKLPDLMPAPKKAPQEQERHGWAYAPPLRSALRHKLTAITEKQLANATGLPWVRALYGAARKNALARKIEFGMTLEDVAGLAVASKGRCTVTGIALSTDRGELATGRRLRRPWAPSLDRLDSSKGYALDNCRVVCCAANYAMSQWGEEVLVEMAKAIARKRITRLGLVASG